MWFMLVQLPFTWLMMYMFGSIKLNSADAVVAHFLMLWNIEPIFSGKFPRTLTGIAKLALITFLGALFFSSILGLYWTMSVNAFVPKPYLVSI